MAFIGKNPRFNTSTLTPQSAAPSNPVEGMIYYDDGTVNTEGVYKYQNGAFEFIGSLVDHLKLNPLAADPTSPVQGQLFYSDGTSRTEGLWEFNGTDWIRTGSIQNTLNLIPQSADPVSPVEGELQFADGTARAAGLWQFLSGAWVQFTSDSSSQLAVLSYTVADNSTIGALGSVSNVAFSVLEYNELSGDFGSLDPITHQLTLDAGTYIWNGSQNFFRTNRLTTRIQDITNNVTLIQGNNSLPNSGNVQEGSVSANTFGTFTLTDTAIIQLEARCSATGGFAGVRNSITPVELIGRHLITRIS